MDKKMVNLKINDISVTVPEGTSVLERPGTPVSRSPPSAS